MTSNEIRQSFLDFFRERGHTIVPSAPVIPHGDKTLLFTNAGMNQFKDVFLGEGTRPYTRAADTQKCIRVSGKHNDLEEVGRDTYHHTLFEMLGNWSFGDYYKKEAIGWAWELLTRVWKLDKSRLYATVFESDDEAAAFWESETDIDPSHIQRHGAKDNFWEMGETGPCGPCSEIHYDKTSDKSGGHLVNAGSPEVIEIWNLVFIQYDRQPHYESVDIFHRQGITGAWEYDPGAKIPAVMGMQFRGLTESEAVLEGLDNRIRTILTSPQGVNIYSPEDSQLIEKKFNKAYHDYPNGELYPLPQRHVDTGMGFERVCAVLQNKFSNYETDVFEPYIEWLKQKFQSVNWAHPLHNSGIMKVPDAEQQIAMRVIADHIRALSCAIADGALPGNEGRGYVLRRILRRAARYGRKLGIRIPFLYELSDVVVKTMGPTFPELISKHDLIKKVLAGEETSFNLTLDRGLELFEEIAIREEESESPFISGDEAFKLYDTFGFPIDLTQVLALERGLTIDMPRFEALLQEQKFRGRSDRASKNPIIVAATHTYWEGESPVPPEYHTEFTGYDELEETNAQVLDRGVSYIVLDKTPFYAESGGQIADRGIIREIHGGNTHVTDVKKSGDYYMHYIDEPAIQEIGKGDVVIATVDKTRRYDIMRNHTATHLMHSALRQILGEHVHQAGSLVTEERLRFDFAHYQKVSPEELHNIEELVNEKIREAIKLHHHRNIPFDEAKKMGALMFFGDKYGARVNVVDFGPFSREFCGGTHVQNSSEIGLFKLTSEGSIASGTRRIEAVTGRGVEKWINDQLSKNDELSREREKLEDEKRKLEKEIAKLKLGSRKSEADAIANSSKPLDVTKISVATKEVSASDAEELKSFAEMVQAAMGNGEVVVLGAKLDGGVSLIAIVSDDIAKEKKIQAGKLVGAVAEIVGGKGGGRPNFAQAGGKHPEKLDEALAKVMEIVRSML